MASTLLILKVPDMGCEHCKSRISKALEEKGARLMRADLTGKLIEVDLGEVHVGDVTSLLDDLGFPTERV